MTEVVEFENLKTIAQVVIALKSLKTSFEDKIKTLEERIMVLETEKSQRESASVASFSSVVASSRNWSTSSSRSKAPVEQLVVVNAAINEQKNREKRRKNIIVYGLPVSKKVTIQEQQEEDKEEISKLFGELNIQVIPVYQRRLKTKSHEKPGPVLVILNEVSVQEKSNPIKSKIVKRDAKL